MQWFFTSFKNAVRLFVAGFAILVWMSACTKADVQFGSQFATDEYTQIVMTDTFSVEAGTVLIDSFITAGSGAGLVGAYNDAAFGKVEAEDYCQLAPPTFTDKTVAYDSAEVVLHLNRNFYGDSTKALPINIYRLDASITKSDNSSFYNKDQIAHSSMPIGSKQCSIDPNITDTISIRIDDNLGKTLLSMLQSGDEQLSSADNFTTYFKGICISAGVADALIAGFKDSVELRLHYRDVSSSVATAKVAAFTLNNNTKQFNHISVDRTGTALANINTAPQKYLSSTATGNEAFLQSITGTVIKIRIPNIRNLQQIGDFVKISRAILHVKPAAGTYGSFYTLPDSLRLSETDKTNAVGIDLTNSLGYVQYGDFYRDDLYNENTAYTYDLTTYLTQQLAITGDNENGLLLTPPSTKFNTSLQRLIIAGALSKAVPITLELYYLSVQ